MFLNFESIGDGMVLAILCLLPLLLLWYSSQRPSGVAPGPGFALPVLGHILSVGTDPRVKFREWRKRYGDIFSLYLGNKLVVVINGYDAIVDAFVKKADIFSDRPHLFVLAELQKGRGLISTSGQVWREQRRFTLSTLRDFGMGKQLAEHAISEECAQLTKHINDSQGKVFNIRPFIHASVANIISTILIGKRFTPDDEFFQEMTRRMDEGGEIAGFTAGLNFIPLGRYVPGDPFRYKETFSNSSFFQNRVAWPAIEDHRKTFDNDNISDFVSAYIKEIKAREKINQESSIGFDNLAIVIVDLIFAGSETTTTTLRWILLYLMKYPEIQEKCFREIEAAVGLENTITMSDKLKLPYIEATITEAQRMANILPLSVWHSVPYDVTFRGFRFPKGVIVLPNLDSVLHDPKIFENPDEFRPERFLDSNGRFMKRPEMIPFFVGKRACVGESLARMELFLFVTSLIRGFKFQYPEDEPPMTFDAVPGITYGPKPYELIAVPR